MLDEAAISASRTDTFLGERYCRIAWRRGKKRALVAVGRSILIIVWQLRFDPDAQFHDLGADFYDTRLDTERAKRNDIQHLEALGYTVTLEPKSSDHDDHSHRPSRLLGELSPGHSPSIPLAHRADMGENCQFLSPVVEQNRVVRGRHPLLLLAKVVHGFSRISRARS